jgi:hypothetical protein
VGHEVNGNGVQTAMYWSSKGNKTLGGGRYDSYTYRLFVDNNDDVYVAGGEWDGGGWLVPKLWQNGSLRYNLNLNAGWSVPGYDCVPTDGEALDVFVRGTDIYVVGTVYYELYNYGNYEDYSYVPVLWKNNVPRCLAMDHEWSYGQAHSVHVATNGDVYVAGEADYLVGSGWESCAMVWVNGSIRHLTQGTGGVAFGITMANNAVYAVGFESAPWFGANARSAKLWELSPTGAARSTTSIGAGTGSSSASSVYASGGDIFVALWEHDSSNNLLAKYYKNGSLRNLGNPSKNPQALGISGHSGNAYVVGSDIQNGIEVAKYWKDGEEHTISGSGREAIAFGIAVK